MPEVYNIRLRTSSRSARPLLETYYLELNHGQASLWDNGDHQEEEERSGQGSLFTSEWCCHGNGDVDRSEKSLTTSR